LRRLHADPGRGRRGAERPAGLRRGDPRDLQIPPRRAGGVHEARRLGHPFAAGLDVRLGAGAGSLSRKGLDGVRQATAHPCQGHSAAGHRLRRIWRGLRACGAGRERASHPPGGAQREEVPIAARQRAGCSGTREVKPLKIAMAGLGTVGGGVVKALANPELAERAGRELEIVAVSARDTRKARGFDTAAFKWISDAVALAKTDADVVVELIGGEDGVALSLAEAALASGKHVVTGNKALLAKHGARLAALAERNGVALKFEAAVAGGIPIVKALRESLVAYGVETVRGILNGTCNYILTQMEATGRSFAEVLAEAQKLGYAEADPELDIGGGDTAHKLVLLASLAFGTIPDQKNIAVEGIKAITTEDIRFAREFGFRIKLLGIARRTRDGIDQRAQP